MPLLCGITFKYLEILSLPWYEWGSNKRVINLCSWNHPISDKSYTENCPYPALFALSGSCPSWLTHNPKHPGTCPESLPLALLSSSEVWLRYSPGDKRSRKRTLRIPANFLTRTLSLSSTLFQKELLERRTVSREEELHRLFSLFSDSVQFRDLCVFFDDAVASWQTVHCPRAVLRSESRWDFFNGWDGFLYEGSIIGQIYLVIELLSSRYELNCGRILIIRVWFILTEIEIANTNLLCS